MVQLVGETCSTATLELLGGQNALLDALADVSRETGKPMVTVLVSSKPQVLPRSIVGDSGVLAGRCNDPKSGAGSILWAPNPGMEGGQAIAEIILGEVNPSGRLPITFPCHAGQLPVYYNQIRGQHGNRYADLTQDPAFAFGEGEGYTTFAYGEPTIVGGASNADGTFAQTDTVHAEIALTNTGRRAGTEVVQAYVATSSPHTAGPTANSRRSAASRSNRARPRPSCSTFRSATAPSPTPMRTASSNPASSSCSSATRRAATTSSAPPSPSRESALREMLSREPVPCESVSCGPHMFPPAPVVCWSGRCRLCGTEHDAEY